MLFDQLARWVCKAIFADGGAYIETLRETSEERSVFWISKFSISSDWIFYPLHLFFIFFLNGEKALTSFWFIVSELKHLLTANTIASLHKSFLLIMNFNHGLLLCFHFLPQQYLFRLLLLYTYIMEIVFTFLE